MDHTPFSENHWSIGFYQESSHRALEVLELEFFGQFILLSCPTIMIDELYLKSTVKLSKILSRNSKKAGSPGTAFLLLFFGGRQVIIMELGLTIDWKGGLEVCIGLDTPLR